MTPTSEEVRRAELLANLTRLIHSPSSKFAPDNTFEKQIFSNEELSRRALQTGLQHAQRDLEFAITRHIAALEYEAQRLRLFLQTGRQQLLPMQQAKDKNEMKGNISQMVHQRWSFEEQTKEMVGEARIEELRQEQRRRSRFLELN